MADTNAGQENWLRYFQARTQPAEGGCVRWTGHVAASGYGRAWPGSARMSAHRMAYLLFRGDVPAGLTLDHLCRNRWCVNPDHLEPVTNAENVRRGVGLTAENARKTHCPKGHPYSGDNLCIRSNGGRACIACRRESDRRRRRRVGYATTPLPTEAQS